MYPILSIVRWHFILQVCVPYHNAPKLPHKRGHQVVNLSPAPIHSLPIPGIPPNQPRHHLRQNQCYIGEQLMNFIQVLLHRHHQLPLRAQSHVIAPSMYDQHIWPQT
ncbi:hypothetical protein XELAEV_18010902mg [Xenopus laevis]|uniref:Uncharacterized protein n=1 Tax=Xenopus laevis TaxID=8355 RepID=A0A974DWR3_XENLA|nr:hypothetical protein XELAEV_18010902mg [Xenopus laevis]